jgi:hypothetical protein
LSWVQEDETEPTRNESVLAGQSIDRVAAATDAAHHACPAVREAGVCPDSPARLADGQQSLVFVSDDNFSPIQVT